MAIDFQHHYIIPVELAKKRGLYSETGRTVLQQDGLPATTMHRRPYDSALQLDDMAGFAGGTVALNCALRGIRPERLVFASDYPQDFTGVNTDTGRGMGELKNYIEAIRRLPLDEKAREDVLVGTAARLLKL